MPFVKNLLTAMSSTKVTNWMLVVGFAASITVNVWVDFYKENRSLEREAVIEIKAASTDLQLLAFSFVSALTNNSDESRQARSALSEHLVRLNDILETPGITLDEESFNAAVDFQDTLVTLQNQVLSIDEPEELDGFWLALRDTLQARNLFFEELGERPRET